MNFYSNVEKGDLFVDADGSWFISFRQNRKIVNIIIIMWIRDLPKINTAAALQAETYTSLYLNRIICSCCRSFALSSHPYDTPCHWLASPQLRDILSTHLSSLSTDNPAPASCPFPLTLRRIHLSNVDVFSGSISSPRISLKMPCCTKPQNELASVPPPPSPLSFLHRRTIPSRLFNSSCWYLDVNNAISLRILPK